MKHLKHEQCGYKPINYFDSCRGCSGQYNGQSCFVPNSQIEMHMDDFRKLFQRVPTDEEALELIDTMNGEMEIW